MPPQPGIANRSRRQMQAKLFSFPLTVKVSNTPDAFSVKRTSASRNNSQGADVVLAPILHNLAKLNCGALSLTTRTSGHFAAIFSLASSGQRDSTTTMLLNTASCQLETVCSRARYRPRQTVTTLIESNPAIILCRGKPSRLRRREGQQNRQH